MADRTSTGRLPWVVTLARSATTYSAWLLMGAASSIDCIDPSLTGHSTPFTNFAERQWTGIFLSPPSLLRLTAPCTAQRGPDTTTAPLAVSGQGCIPLQSVVEWSSISILPQRFAGHRNAGGQRQ